MNKALCMSVLITGSLLLGVSCSSSDEKAEQVAAAAEAQQMEEAKGVLPDPVEAGRMEARKFLTRTWKDSLQLHSQLLEVKAMSSRYVLAGDKASAQKFDSIFISTLRTVNPDLCADIEKGLK